MANELRYNGNPADQTGLTIVARIYLNGVQQGSDVACTEQGSTAIYLGNAPVLGAGTYLVRFFSGSDMVGQGVLNWDGTKEIEITSSEIAGHLDAYSNKDDFKADVSDKLGSSDIATIVTQVWSAATRSLTDKADFALSAADKAALAVQIEAALINEGDGQQLIDAIVTLINTNLDLPSLELAAIANEVRSNLAVELARIDTTISSRSTQASLDNIPTNPVLTNDSRLDNLDTTVSSRSAFDHTTQNVLVDLSSVLNAISALNDVSVTEIRAGFDEAEFKNDQTEIHAFLNAYANKNDWKADVSSLAAMAANLVLILKYHQGNVILDENTNTLTVLDPADGTTPLLTFNTKGIDGSPAHESIYELESQ